MPNEAVVRIIEKLEDEVDKLKKENAMLRGHKKSLLQTITQQNRELMIANGKIFELGEELAEWEKDPERTP